MASAPTLTNQELGARIGLTHSSVSRIRSGHRLPSLDIMARIEQAFGFSLQDQVKARKRSEKEPLAYAEALERAVGRTLLREAPRPAVSG